MSSESRHRLFTSAFCAVMAVAWLALLLAELGCFSAPPCLLLGLAAGALAFRFSPAPPDCETAPGGGVSWWHLAVLATVALGTLVFTRHPHEWVLGGWDPGVYVQTAAHIFRTGALMIREPDLNRLTPAEFAILTRHLSTMGAAGPFLCMWYLPDGRLTPQFHHLYPSLLAVTMWAGSFAGMAAAVKAALLVNPLLNCACIVAMFGLARRIVRPPFALAAAVLLALNPAQLWQAKFSTAEMLGQFLLLGGALFFLDAMRRDGGARAAVIAGAAFGLALLARYDTVILFAPLFALTAAAWPWLPNRRGAAFTMLAFVPFLIHYFIHRHYFMQYYQPVGGLVFAAFALIATGLGAWLLALRFTVIRSRLASRARWLPLIATVALAAWCCFVTARPWLPEGFAGSLRLGSVTGDDKNNVLFIAAIFGPGVWLYAAGLLYWIFSERDVVRAIWLYASTAVLVVLVTSVFNDHTMMWVARRYVPVCVPLLVLGLVVMLDRVFAKPGLLRRAVAPLLVTAVLAANFPATRAMAVLCDWPGLVNWCARVAPAAPAGARVFCDQPGFAPPLRFFYGIHAYELQIPEKEKGRRDKLAVVLAAAARRGETIFLLTMRGPIPGHDLVFTECGDFPLASDKLPGGKAVPRKTKPAGGDFKLYRVSLKPAS